MGMESWIVNVRCWSVGGVKYANDDLYFSRNNQPFDYQMIYLPGKEGNAILTYQNKIYFK